MNLNDLSVMPTCELSDLNTSHFVLDIAPVKGIPRSFAPPKLSQTGADLASLPTSTSLGMGYKVDFPNSYPLSG